MPAWPMLASAALELSGVISGAAPLSVLIPANIVLGVMIGARFQGFTFGEFREALLGEVGIPEFLRRAKTNDY